MPGELIVRYLQNMANVPILCPLKTPENLWSCEVLRGYKTATLARDQLTLSNKNLFQAVNYMLVNNRNTR